MDQRGTRDPAEALLGQVARGLTTYRLFPGDLAQPAFVAVAERIRAEAAKRLAEGPVAATMHASGARTPSGTEVRDESVARLALACYERRVEVLAITAVPGPRELAALYEALTAPVGEVSTAGGVAALLRRAGVTSIEAHEVSLHAGDTATEPASPVASIGGEPLARGLSGEPDQQARTLLARLEALARLSPEVSPGAIDIYRKLAEAVSALSDETRWILAEALSGTGDGEQSPAAGLMTDDELARMLVELSRGGPLDPVELARRLVADGARRQDLLDLTVAATGAVPPIGGSPAAATDLLSRPAIADEDARAIRDAFPATPEDRRALAVGALRDYLVVEDDPARVDRVMAVWADRAREAIRGRDRPALSELAGALEAALALAEGDTRKVEALERGARLVVDRSLVDALVEVAGDEPAGEDLRSLVSMLGGGAVDGLLDMLGEEEDRRRRMVLVTYLAGMAAGHQERVAARMDDERWFLARNAVTVLWRSGQAAAAPLVGGALRHAFPQVRREAVVGLASIGGEDGIAAIEAACGDPDPSVRATALGALGSLLVPEAAEALAHVARTGTHTAERRRALDELARHATPAAERMLTELASRARPRLPRRLRRHARALVRTAREGNG